MPLPRTARLFAASLVALSASLVVAGCGTQTRSAATQTHTVSTSPTPNRPDEDFVLAPAPQPHKPDLARLDFNAVTRTLTLYQLPERSGRWMLASPATPSGVPVDGEYTFPPEVEIDLDRVAVFYTVPNRRPSPAVSLREIVEAHQVRAVP